jgi:hypothetical protein
MLISKINSEKKTWFQPRVNRIKYILAFVWITCMTSRASRHLSPRLRHVTNTKLCFALPLRLNFARHFCIYVSFVYYHIFV